MIDAKEMSACHVMGLQNIRSLEGDELLVLQLYCQAFAEKTIEDGKHRGAPTEDLVINAVKDGIALGLGLQVVNCELQKRPD